MGKQNSSRGQKRAAKVKARQQRQAKQQARFEELAQLDIPDYQLESEEELDFDQELQEMLEILDSELRIAVANTLKYKSPEPALDFDEWVAGRDDAIADDREPDGEQRPGALFSIYLLVGWLRELRADQADLESSDKAFEWIQANLEPECVQLAAIAAHIYQADPGERSVIEQAFDDLEGEVLPALVWLVAGAVAEYGNGDIACLSHPGSGEEDEAVEA